MRAIRPDRLATLLSGGSVAGLTDRELLDRFIAREEGLAEVAFEALVHRHGSLVWGVCRRILLDPSDAEDAFQATFLILVRRARSVQVDDSLGRWLSGVARKVATRTRADRLNRQRRENPEGDVALRAESRSSAPSTEILALLDGEVARLAEPFRSAILLCDLGGRTHEQAAVELKCPVGTIKSRLARGRDRLRDQLTRRGVHPSDLHWQGLAVGGTGGVVPQRLVIKVARAAILAAGSGSGISWFTVPGWTVVFSQGVRLMNAIWPQSWVLGTVLSVGLASTALIGAFGSGDEPPAAARLTSTTDKPDLPVQAPATPADLPRESKRVLMPDYVVEPPDIIVVEVLNALPDKRISGERLVRPDGKISLGYYGEVFVAGLTTTEIKAKLVLHLRKYLTDDQLGLPQPTDENARRGAQELALAKHVFVDVSSYNSKVYYVQGQVKAPGRFPITGNETVLDAVNYAELIVKNTGRNQVRLVRPGTPQKPGEQSLAVDLKAIVEQGDSRTNYQVMPGDRVVVVADLSDLETEVVRTNCHLNEQKERLDKLEQKLDLILRRLESLEKPH